MAGHITLKILLLRIEIEVVITLKKIIPATSKLQSERRVESILINTAEGESMPIMRYCALESDMLIIIILCHSW